MPYTNPIGTKTTTLCMSHLKATAVSSASTRALRSLEAARVEVHRALASHDLHGSVRSGSLARPSAPSAILLPASLRYQAVPSVRCQAVPAAATVAALVKEVEKSQLRQLPRDVENVADDPNLHNPLQRQQRLSTGWMGVVMEYEGVLVEETQTFHHQAWRQLAEEEGKPAPLQFALKRAAGMKAEQIIQEVFCWTRKYSDVRRIAQRKEELYKQLLGQHKPMLSLGVQSLLSSLQQHQVPTALAAAEPEARLKLSLKEIGLDDAFQVIVSAEDMSRGSPDPEGYLLAAQQLGRPPMRCVVIGNSNQSVEAARECGMAAVVVAGRKPLYEMGAADLVVKQLDELSFKGLKNLFGMEALVQPQEQQEEESTEPGYRRY